MPSAETDGTRVADLYAISAYLRAVHGVTVPVGTLRQWASRYRDEMPRMGTEMRRGLYRIDDVEAVAARRLDPGERITSV